MCVVRHARSFDVWRVEIPVASERSVRADTLHNELRPRPYFYLVRPHGTIVPLSHWIKWDSRRPGEHAGRRIRRLEYRVIHRTTRSLSRRASVPESLVHCTEQRMPLFGPRRADALIPWFVLAIQTSSI